MPVYAMMCEVCSNYKEVTRTLKQGAPTRMKCEFCDTKMYQDYSQGGGFILKGDGWAGKEISQDNAGTINTASRDRNEAEAAEYDSARAEMAEVDKARSGGHKKSKEFAQSNPDKMKRYWANMNKGMKPTGYTKKKKDSP